MLIVVAIRTVDPAICPAQILRTPPLKRKPTNEIEAENIFPIRLPSVATGLSVAEKTLLIRLDITALMESAAVNVRKNIRDLTNAAVNESTAVNALGNCFVIEAVKLRTAKNPASKSFFVCAVTNDSVAAKVLPTVLLIDPLKLKVAVKLWVKR